MLSVGVGMPYQCTCSLPQGYPWPMLLLGTLTRPLTIMVVYLSAIHRSFADDLKLTTKGPGQWPALKKVATAVFRFLSDVGARVAHSKSALGSASNRTRALIRIHCWSAHGGTIAVLRGR